MTKLINVLNFNWSKGANCKGLRSAMLLALLELSIGNAFAFTSTAKYSIAKTSDTPSGAGMIYGYRGGGDATTSGGTPYLEGDKLKTGGLSWVAAETGMDLAEMTIKQSGGSGDNYSPNTDAGNRPDGYRVLDRATDNGDNTVHALHMYFYAKPNAGYEYMGWYTNAAGTTSATGSTDHYPYPNTSAAGPKKKKSQTYTPTRWDNGEGSELPASGPYSDFFYLRYVELLTKSQATADKTMYVKFQVIPRHFKFVGTGFADVTYTAGGTNVGANTVESGNITSNIALNITFDSEKYNFVKWQWSLGPDGAKTDIATTASATYTFAVDRGYPVVNYSTNPHSYGAYTMVYIWPILQEKVDAEATVKIGDADPVPYAHWADAFAAAKADGVSGAIVTLKKDITGITTTHNIDRNMTLDLNGHTITGGGTNSYMFTVSGSGTVFTLCDNTPASAGRIVYNTSEVQYPYAVGVQTGAKLIITSGGVSATSTKSDGSSRGVEIQSGGTLEMTGGELYSQSYKSAYALINRGTATIGGGNLRARAQGTSTTGTGKTAVAFYNVGTSATIDGGNFTAVADSSNAYAIQMNVASKTLTVNYATATATVGKSIANALRRDNGKILVNGGKYKSATPLNTANKSYIELKGGIYNTYTNVRQSCSSGYDCYEMQPGADWNDGYRFEVIAATDHPRICKVLAVGEPVSYYESLADALAYANNNTGLTMSIILIAFDHTLPSGNYTLPQRADLIVPYNVDQTGVTGATPVRMVSFSTPSAFRTLRFASGASLDAFGKIEAGGRQSVSGTGATGCGLPSGAYGHIVLNEGSSITLESNSVLYGWGYVTGTGEIDARRGSQVHESFQLYGWAGGTNVSGYYSKTFPITEYFIQNVEAPVKYHPGARLTTATGVYVSSTTIPTDEVNVIGVDGDVAMFLMDNEDDSEDTWVRKRYDAAKDQQVFEINSSARLGSLQITFTGVPLLGTLDIDSRNYVLPITHNMKIHLLTGNMGITQSTTLLPGTEMEVDKEATLAINSGQNLNIFDDAEWGNKVYNNVPAHRIKYRPIKTPDNTIRDISSAAALGDAKLFVHGTFDVQGKLYTTSTGANIYSTNEDAGTIKFTSAAATSNSSVKIYSGTDSNTEDVTTVPALLRNGDNSTTDTKNTVAGKSFAYTDNKWVCWTQDGCFYKDNIDTYYAKPADYVALLNGKTENADHTYTSADGTRTFILVEGCQWWEVELEDADKGLWHCTHPSNDVYYYYNGSAWVVKKQTVVWKNYDGSTIVTYNNVPYKTTPVYNSATPTRPMDDYYTYDFNGWSPALAPITADMEYMAQYTPKDRKYTIIFKNEDGSVIETDYCTMGQVPVCSKEPTKAGYTLVWSPTIEAVTGDAIYQATFTNVVASEYTVTFKNYNNTATLQTGAVTTGTMPVYSGATPTKPATIDQYFVWSGWEPALHNVDADVIYTPTFNAFPITDREFDVVDWTSTSLTINGNGLKTAAGGTDWKIRVEGKDKDYVKTDRNTTTRTLTVSGLSLTPDNSIQIQMKNAGGDIESKHTYKIPHIYTTNTSLSGTTATSVVYVKSGKLTISASTTLAALYVSPGAEVEITSGTLTVGKLVLRTTPWASAAISGSVSATNVYYTRIGPDGSDEYKASKYYQFGLPYTCAISAVRLSDGSTPAYNNTWALKKYDEESRAINGATGNNWVALNSSAAIEAGRGYEIFSSQNYYREYYFPVTPTSNKLVPVTRHGDDNANSGWNIICSPLMSVYTNESDPVTGIKVSWLLTDGSYDQQWPEYIWPALPFSYQAAANGSLDFSSGDFNQTVSAPKRRPAFEENIQTEWLHLDVKDANGVGDHTTVFVHPYRFEDIYETGIDVAKQSLEASRALIYSSLEYGEMAFAGVADSIFEQGVALTVYSPKAQELTISMRENEWLNRMAFVWFIDQATGAQIDLLESDYSFEAEAGTTAGRFILMGAFFAPQITTDNGNVESDEDIKAKKFIYNGKMYIQINGVIYDATGRLVK